MWVARCRGGHLFLYENKPFRNEKYGGWDNIGGGGIITLDSSLFTELKWEDEPIEVELVPKGSRIGSMEKENVLPLVLKVMEKTIGYELEGYNPETGRWIHSMRDGGAEFTDEEMDERKSKWEEILMRQLVQRQKMRLMKDLWNTLSS